MKVEGFDLFAGCTWAGFNHTRITRQLCDAAPVKIPHLRGSVLFSLFLPTEEILHTHVAHWWSPDGERLAFLVLNDSLVPNMALPRFTGMTYPRGKQYPYPKVNMEASPVAALWWLVAVKQASPPSFLLYWNQTFKINLLHELLSAVFHLQAGQANPAVKLYVVNLYGPTHTLELVPPDTLKLRWDLRQLRSRRLSPLVSVNLDSVFRRWHWWFLRWTGHVRLFPGAPQTIGSSAPVALTIVLMFL